MRGAARRGRRVSVLAHGADTDHRRCDRHVVLKSPADGSSGDRGPGVYPSLLLRHHTRCGERAGEQLRRGVLDGGLCGDRVLRAPFLRAERGRAGPAGGYYRQGTRHGARHDGGAARVIHALLWSARASWRQRPPLPSTTAASTGAGRTAPSAVPACALPPRPPLTI